MEAWLEKLEEEGFCMSRRMEGDGVQPSKVVPVNDGCRGEGDC